MFHQNTVLVLGAGASAPYGFPTGPALLSNIKSQIDQLIPKIGSLQIQNPSQLNFGALSVEVAYQILSYTNLTASNNKLKEWLAEMGEPDPSAFDIDAKFRRLATLLGRADLPSIDEFLRQNPSISTLGRLIVAIELTLVAYEKANLSGSSIRLRTNLFRENSGERIEEWQRRHWYRLLTQTLMKDATLKNIKDNKLSIVTFNYDTSLEHFLSEQLSASEMFEGLDYREVVEPIHTYGVLPPLRATGQNFSFADIFDSILQAATKIRLIDDKADQKQRSIVQNAINNSDHILIMGFAAERQNADFLAIQSDYVFAKKRVRAINWDGNEALNQRLSAIGIDPTSDIIKPPTIGSRIEIAAAIENGFFQEPQIKKGIF